MLSRGLSSKALTVVHRFNRYRLRSRSNKGDRERLHLQKLSRKALVTLTRAFNTPPRSEYEYRKHRGRFYGGLGETIENFGGSIAGKQTGFATLSGSTLQEFRDYRGFRETSWYSRHSQKRALDFSGVSARAGRISRASIANWAPISGMVYTNPA